MFKGFNLKLDKTDFLGDSVKYTKILKEKKDNIKLTIDNIMLLDGKLDAEQIVNEWFPKQNYHVFISHSHKDTEIAEQLANWLYDNFNIMSFIDSHVWGYANELLHQLNNLYAKSDEATYHYEPAISNAAHVYLMLSTALSEMIDKSECLLFLNTENTIENIEIKSGSSESKTASPWIMHELKTSSFIQRKPSADRSRPIHESIGFEALSVKKSAEFFYNAPTAHLLSISDNHLSSWLSECTSYPIPKRRWITETEKEYVALDVLYKITETEA